MHFTDFGGEAPKEDVVPELAFMVHEPIERHAYSQVEMEAWSKSWKAKAGPPKSFRQIIKAAMDFKRTLGSNSCSEEDHPWVHRPGTPYRDQELVHICCLVDRIRFFSVSMTVHK
jgi:hypothetical protein